MATHCGKRAAQSTRLRKGERPARCMVSDTASSRPSSAIIRLVARHDRKPRHSATGSLKMADTYNNNNSVRESMAYRPLFVRGQPPTQ